jgi:hypothetical protein
LPGCDGNDLHKSWLSFPPPISSPCSTSWPASSACPKPNSTENSEEPAYFLV